MARPCGATMWYGLPCGRDEGDRIHEWRVIDYRNPFWVAFHAYVTSNQEVPNG